MNERRKHNSETKKARDEQIKRKLAEGKNYSQIGRETNLSHEGVRKIAQRNGWKSGIIQGKERIIQKAETVGKNPVDLVQESIAKQRPTRAAKEQFGVAGGTLTLYMRRNNIAYETKAPYHSSPDIKKKRIGTIQGITEARRRVPTNEYTNIRQQYLNGEPVKELAQRYQVTPGRIYQIFGEVSRKGPKEENT